MNWSVKRGKLYARVQSSNVIELLRNGGFNEVAEARARDEGTLTSPEWLTWCTEAHAHQYSPPLRTA